MKQVRNGLSQALLLGLMSLTSSAAHAYLTAPAPFDISIHTGMGSETGTLQWSIAGDPDGQTGPNVLSELTYRDVKFSVFNASANVDFNQGFLRDSHFFFDYRAGQAIDGEAQDSDYDGNNRSQEYSRSLSSTEDSTLSALELGFSHQYPISGNMFFEPAVAYVRHQQNMVMTNGVQVVDTYDPTNLGAFRGTLNSTYETQWNGLWAGFNWALKTRNHHLSLGLRQYWLDYHAVADWNLRSDFAHPKSFEHWAVGTGTGLDINYRYQFSDSFSVNMNWHQLDWETTRGKDRVFFADGSSADSQLNEVTWAATGYNMGLQLLF